MDIFFADPSEVLLPPDQVRIRELRLELWPDGQRMRVYLEVDPFQIQKKPNAELSVLDQHGMEVSSVSVIQSMTRKMELVMHLRNAPPGGYSLQAVLYYADLPQAAPPGEEPGSGASPEPSEPIIERQVVDTRQVSFEIPA
jgi:hypothetical protein